jgi:hypothetical protein
MKSKFNLLISAIAVAGSCLLNSCGKDGETGPSGTNGAAGTNGTNGTNGNANVKTTILTVLSADWSGTALNKSTGVLSAPNITQSILDSGLVLVYVKAPGIGLNGNFIQTPVLYFGSSTATCYHVINGVGGLKLTCYDPNPSSSFVLTPSPMTVKVVTATAHMRMANPNLDWSNYNDVKKALNLQD